MESDDDCEAAARAISGGPRCGDWQLASYLVYILVKYGLDHHGFKLLYNKFARFSDRLD